MPIEAADTIAALKALAGRLDDTAKDITADALHIVQAAGVVFAPVGTPGNIGGFPGNGAPGDLKRSIEVFGPTGADGVYEGQVGPTVVYAAQREYGGAIYPKHARALAFQKFADHLVIGPTIRKGHDPRTNTYYIQRAGVYQLPHPYMRPARDTSLSAIGSMAIAKVAATVEGS